MENTTFGEEMDPEISVVDARESALEVTDDLIGGEQLAQSLCRSSGSSLKIGIIAIPHDPTDDGSADSVRDALGISGLLRAVQVVF